MLTPAHSFPIGTPINFAMYPPVKFPIAPVGSTISILESCDVGAKESSQERGYIIYSAKMSSALTHVTWLNS